MNEEDRTRFWAKVDRNGPVVRPELGNCWVWTASKRNGYGAARQNKKTVSAHRFSYEMEYGELPALIRHKCDNRSCVRPSHLEPGTHIDNTKDRFEDGRNKTSLTNEAVIEARKMAAAGESLYNIWQTVAPRAEKYGVMNAIQGKTFPFIEEPTVDIKDVYRPIFNKLTEEQYAEILVALSRPYHGQGKALAAKYGVHPSMITLIKKKKLKTIRGASHK